MLLSSGQFTFKIPLLSVSALGGMGWSLGLNYLSDNDIESVLGVGFNFPQNIFLTEDPGVVDLWMGSQTVESFVELTPSPPTYGPASSVIFSTPTTRTMRAFRASIALSP